ncbi:MAG: DUF3179 domain-containing (seleno)protein [Myxococcota bacterium]
MSTKALGLTGLVATAFVFACGSENGGRSGLPPPDQQRQPSTSADTYAWTPLALTSTDFGFIDRTTGSTFNLRGEAVAGPLAEQRRRLQPVSGFNMFWFAMSAFYPGAPVWHPDGDRQVKDELLADDKSGIRACPGGRDCIPSLPVVGKPNGNLAWTRPGADDVDYLRDSDLVLGVFVDGVARAYPHNVLWWHEIANDRIDDIGFSVTFCPLTGSGVGFSATAADRSFGVSGQLFNSNLVMYDHDSRTLIPQLWMGPADRSSDWLQQFPIMEMTWGLWQQLFPDTIVLSADTGYDRDYRQYPYGDFRTNDLDTFTVTAPLPDRQYPNKTMIYALVDRGASAVRGYVHDDLDAISTDGRMVINDTFNGRPVVIVYQREMKRVVGSRERIHGFVQAFWADTPEGTLEFDLRSSQ